MPYKSEKQRRFLHAKHPEIAARWDAEYGRKVSKRDRDVAELMRLERMSPKQFARQSITGGHAEIQDIQRGQLKESGWSKKQQLRRYRSKVSKARIPKAFTKKRALAMGAGGGTGLLAYREVPKMLKPPMGYEQEYVYKGLSPNQIEGLKRAYGNADADIETERARMGNAFSDDTSQHVNRQKYAFARRMRKVEGDRAAKQIAREKAGGPQLRRGYHWRIPGKEIITAEETIGHGARNKIVEDRSLQLAQRHQPLRVPPSIAQQQKRSALLTRRPDLVPEMKGRKALAEQASQAKYRAAGVRAYRIFAKSADVPGLNDLGLRNVLLHDRDSSRSAVSKAVATDSWADEQRYLENKQRADDKRRSGHKKTQIGTLMLGTTGLAGISAPQWDKNSKQIHIGSLRKPAHTLFSSTKSPKGVHNVTTVPRLRITSTKNPLLWAGTGAGLVGWGAAQRASAGRQKHKLNRSIDNRMADEQAVRIQQWASRGSLPKKDSE